MYTDCYTFHLKHTRVSFNYINKIYDANVPSTIAIALQLLIEPLCSYLILISSSMFTEFFIGCMESVAILACP
jgi:hypothetical protein